MSCPFVWYHHPTWIYPWSLKFAALLVHAAISLLFDTLAFQCPDCSIMRIKGDSTETQSIHDYGVDNKRYFLMGGIKNHSLAWMKCSKKIESKQERKRERENNTLCIKLSSRTTTMGTMVYIDAGICKLLQDGSTWKGNETIVARY